MDTGKDEGQSAAIDGASGDLKVNLSSIEAFVVAASHTSLKDAADHLGVGEDTFRKRLNAFERWVDAPLTQRNPDVILTLDGHKLLPHAQTIVEQAKILKNTMTIGRAMKRISGKVHKPPTGSYRKRNDGKHITIEVD